MEIIDVDSIIQIKVKKNLHHMATQWLVHQCLQ